MMTFLSHGKMSRDEKSVSILEFPFFVNYPHAIKRGAEYSGGDHLKAKYCNEMDVYLESMKRENATANHNQFE